MSPWASPGCAPYPCDPCHPEKGFPGCRLEMARKRADERVTHYQIT